MLQRFRTVKAVRQFVLEIISRLAQLFKRTRFELQKLTMNNIGLNFLPRLSTTDEEYKCGRCLLQVPDWTTEGFMLSLFGVQQRCAILLW